ncbi:MAG: hypothetical protein IJ008_03565 [Clostridia bacterium]|nr:hypothetical protein [Clostridia bacterium]
MEDLRKLNEMVKAISLGLDKNTNRNYGERAICTVEFFNGEKLTFKDKNNQLYRLLMAYKKCGIDINNVITSKRLIEDYKSNKLDDISEDDKDSIDNDKSTFVAVLYEVDGYKYYLFPSDFTVLRIIDLYYNKFLELRSEKNKIKKDIKE